MASYKIFWKASTREVQFAPAVAAAPSGFTLLETITHDDGADELGIKDNHVVWHHVRDALYEQDHLDMSNITIAVPVYAIDVTPATAELSVAGGETVQLVTAINPVIATNQDLTYESSDPTKATVSASGLVTAVAAGTATITVTADGGKTDTVAVTVVA